ncbi:MAG: CcmD family protein [Chitinophagales bacterium]
MKKALIVFAILLLNTVLLAAQDTSLDEQAGNFLRESGKLYVVITILVTIFAGIVIFLIFQERRISQLEKKIKDNEKP